MEGPTPGLRAFLGSWVLPSAGLGYSQCMDPSSFRLGPLQPSCRLRGGRGAPLRLARGPLGPGWGRPACCARGASRENSLGPQWGGDRDGFR